MIQPSGLQLYSCTAVSCTAAFIIITLVYSTVSIAPYTRVQTQRSTSGAAANIAARTPPILAAPHELVEDLVRIIITITDGRYGINYSCIIITGRL